MQGRVWEKVGCLLMEMGVKAKDLQIDELFFSLFSNGRFTKFCPPGMEEIQGGGDNFFEIQVW